MGCKVVLGDICSFSRGASIPRARMHDTGDYLYIHYGDLYKGFDLRIDVESPSKPIPFILRGEKVKESQCLKDQDIVYVLTSETVDDLGHAYLFNNPQNKLAVSGTETTIVRVKRRDLVIPAYLNYLMSSPCFIGELRRYVRGMKVFRVHPADVSRIEIELPHIETQRKVVSILDSIYTKQRINTQLNGYLLELASTIFKTWFMNDDARYSTNKVAISEIAVINAGGDKPNVCQKTPSNKCPVPVYSNGTDNEGLYGYTSMAKVTEPSVTVSARGTIGFTCLRHQPYYPIVRLISATPKEGITVEYLYLWLRNKMITGVGTTQQQLTVPMFKKYEIDVPSARNLTKFTEIVRPLFNAIAANKTENTELVELRNALLPKLMSGEIDVSKIDLTQLNSHLAEYSTVLGKLFPLSTLKGTVMENAIQLILAQMQSVLNSPQLKRLKTVLTEILPGGKTIKDDS